ncbi:hypothetical protein [Marinobacter sp. X15-166B]|uniref:hypothetical protein n=1 Tax=Marinobacter sp. X15-166B TaxID=1897620 RepID=UPI00085C23A6|nr:hypothetical protein [Marinobacter sp. X15-166B]OEY65635.1 hypothetical protein BG841_03645 [Marinobacter sp. X15-166B]
MFLDKKDTDSQYFFIRCFVEQVQDRVERWDDARLLLTALDIPVSNGWEATFRKLNSQYEEGRLKVFQYSKSKLTKILDELNLSSDKAVSVYSIPDQDTAQKIANHLFKNHTLESRFAELYPFKVIKDELDGIDYEPYYCGQTEIDGVYYFPIGIKRDYNERIKLNISEFEEVDRVRLEGYDKIIASKTEVAQFIDIISVNIPACRLEIRIDNASKTSRDDIENARDIIESLLRAQIRELDKNIETPRINMFPIINSLYNSDTGRICELAFECPNDSLHYQHLRKQDQDIRSEPFHDGGKKAVESVDAFRLAVEWEITFGDRDRKIEALFPGTRRMMRQANPDLSYLIVNRHINASEINLTIDRVLQHGHPE